MANNTPEPVGGVEQMAYLRWVKTELGALREDLTRLGMDSGNGNTSLNDNYDLLADQVRRGVSNSYTKTEIDAKFTALTIDGGQVTTGTITRPVSSVGAVAAATTISSGGNATFGGTLTSPGVYSTDLTAIAGARRTAWVHESGLMGHTVSSRKFKREIESFDWDYETLRLVRIVTFKYIAQGKSAPVEFGVIAEELHDLGLGFVVEYMEGQPYSVKWELFGFLAIYIAQKQGDILDDLIRRVTALEG